MGVFGLRIFGLNITTAKKQDVLDAQTYIKQLTVAYNVATKIHDLIVGKILTSNQELMDERNFYSVMELLIDFDSVYKILSNNKFFTAGNFSLFDGNINKTRKVCESMNNLFSTIEEELLSSNRLIHEIRSEDRGELSNEDAEEAIGHIECSLRELESTSRMRIRQGYAMLLVYSDDMRFAMKYDYTKILCGVDIIAEYYSKKRSKLEPGVSYITYSYKRIDRKVPLTPKKEDNGNGNVK